MQLTPSPTAHRNDDGSIDYCGMRRQTSHTTTTNASTSPTRLRVPADTRIAIPIAEWARDRSISRSLARKWAREGLEIEHADGRRERIYLPTIHAGSRVVIDRTAGEAFWAAIQTARVVVAPLGYARRSAATSSAAA